MGEGFLSPGVLSSRVVRAANFPLGGEQSLHPHWTPGVNTTSGDPHLGPQTKAETIREPGAGVVENTGRVHTSQEGVSVVLVLGDDDVRVAGPVPVDVVDGLLHVGDDLHGAGQASIFLGKLLSSLWTKSQPVGQSGSGENLDIRFLQSSANLRGKYSVYLDGAEQR